jgi:hypothetical protein
MPTVVIAPMLIGPRPAVYTRTSATVQFEGRTYVVSTAELAPIEVRRLGNAVLGSLLAFEDEIRHALTFVFVGV